ncbi:hypothetical protein ACHAPT_005377 [Fusarium lateritium]
MRVAGPWPEHGGPFSIASGAAGIISLGFTIAQDLFRVADAIGSAGQEVHIYAEEINAFSKLLNRVKAELANSADVSINLQSLVKDVCESPESAENLWYDMGALLRKVLRLASRTLQSSRQPSTEDTASAPQQRAETEWPVAGSEILYLDGTDASLAATGTGARDRRAQGVYTADDERST